MVDLLHHLELVVVLRTQLLEILLTLLLCLLLFVLHLGAAIGRKLLFEAGVELGDVEALCAVCRTVHFGAVEGLIKCDLLLTFFIWLILFLALSR